MSKKRDPNGGRRTIPPFLFENGDVVALCTDVKNGTVDRYRVIGRSHYNTRPGPNTPAPFNKYRLQSLVHDYFKLDRGEDQIERPATEELLTRVARSQGHKTARVLAAL